MKPKDDEPSNEKTLKTVRVSVKRGNETIAAEVFEHELAILKHMHLYENVNVTDPDYGELTLPNDADLELRRLQAKYDRKNLAVVAHIYRNAADLSAVSGLDVQQTRGERAPAYGGRNSLRVKQAA